MSLVRPDLPAQARRAADEAASHARVRVVEVHEQAGLAEMYEVIDRIWNPEPENPPVTRTLLRVFGHAGGYVVGAYDGSTMIGVCIGFLAAPAGTSLHSHIAGVTAAGDGRHVGFALKLHQRAWALERGLSRVEWTYDPVVLRNGYFNAAKLGALPVRYLVDYYGAMTDRINAGQGSDRMVVHWELDHEPPRGAPSVDISGAVVLLDEVGKAPVRSSGLPAGDGLFLVRVPSDVERLRADAPELALEWRLAVRESLGRLMAEGATVEAVTKAGWYVVRKGTS